MSEPALSLPAVSAACTVVYVDDEPQSCKWFARSFGDEFTILTATGVEAALELLRAHASEVAVLVTDYRMPERDGLDLLGVVLREHRHLVRLLATGYAEKALAIAAVNVAQVFRILEKPLDAEATRQALRDALALHRQQSLQRLVHENRVTAMRDTLGFLAHELNTPLSTVRGYMDGLQARHVLPDALPPGAGAAMFAEQQPGDVLAALAAAERQALYCQSLVSRFVQSARDADPGGAAPGVAASSLVQALLDGYPFEDDERTWVSLHLDADFVLPAKRDLLYLVLCTLTKNALQALRGRSAPQLQLWLGRDTVADRDCIRLCDNGPGIAPQLLARLTLEPATTRAASGGHGMGLVLCRRVLQSLGGSMLMTSSPGQGTCVTLYFQSFVARHAPHPAEGPLACHAGAA